jgi:Zn-dependent metalloprotease
MNRYVIYIIMGYLASITLLLGNTQKAEKKFTPQEPVDLLTKNTVVQNNNYSNQIQKLEIEKIPEAATETISVSPPPKKLPVKKETRNPKRIKKKKKLKIKVSPVNYTPPKALDIKFSTDDFPNNGKMVNSKNFFIKANRKKPIHLESGQEVIDFILQAGKNYFSFSKKDYVQIIEIKKDQFGNNFYKLEQTYDGVKVYARDLIVQTDKNHSFYMLVGTMHTGINIATKWLVTAPEAENFLKQNLASSMKSFEIHERSGLFIYLKDDIDPELVWIFKIKYIENNEEHNDDVMIDANTGKIIGRISWHIH